MALLRCSFLSTALSLETSVTLILPSPTAVEPPVLYLLHGSSGDDSSWLRRTSIERYVEPLGLAVVMPQVHRSCYTDEAYGGHYWTFLTEELPHLVEGMFRVSNRREDTFVAGLSMGGYGAFKWALRQPGRFAAAASLSGALDIASASSGPGPLQDPRMYERIFGEVPIAGSDNDLLTLAARADPAAVPSLGLWCGTQDRALPGNHAFSDACAATDLPLDVELSPGDHEWGYWDAKIQEVLAWLPLNRPPRPGSSAAGARPADERRGR